ncbi:MAG: aromatic ring-hydroxylating dioxygenase subunit alpha [Rhodospirillaceae bacterium]|jgi:phenylpropionate dioxygenase-like ring-hydroxylating dioxygenase large terminal subunit|nr:aromatic ring-hydroxylating dioxygenase subunit alpha [Rhodospirillaceae bacterium]MBT5565192.1 aromatic ring-hydroxylating dioxygenase subunit alpha [Rhodospirillaceae bacterium]MBT6088029.1 aromatic ring-hydroxylating dioxygenase subunit alpha [Rhodospirillaceae bacterium]
MFINFWYAAGRSEDITNEAPTKVRMLGLDFVVFRDSSGQVHCLSDTCVHRGGSLGNGKIKGDCVQCPYHGWEFDGEGACQKVPSLGPGGKPPARARTDAYPVEEKYGLVHVFLGDMAEADRPPIMDIPEYGTEGWRATIQQYDWVIDYQRSVENALDPAHNEFVHPTHGFSGADPDYHVPPLNIDETDWGTGFLVEYKAPPLADDKMREGTGREKNAVVTAGTWTHGPTCNATRINPMPDKHIHQYSFKTPVDDTHSRSYLVNLRNFVIEPENDARMMTRNDVVAGQDGEILEYMNPLVTPPTNTKEIFVPADGAIARYREILKGWEAKGWKIDIDKVEADRKKVAYAIPSPARRNAKGWVIDPVPMVDSSNVESVKQAAE